MKIYLILACGFLLSMPVVQAQTIASGSLPVNCSFMRTSSDITVAPVILDLVALGVSNSDSLVLTAIGTYANTTSSPDTNNSMQCVFSSSNVLLSNTNQVRVPGAFFCRCSLAAAEVSQ